MPDSLRDTVRHAAGLVSKTEAGYSKGTPKEHCGICSHSQHNYTCNKVAGRIFPAMWCKYWTPRA